MGLIKSFFGAAGGVLADQWVDYIKCDALGADELIRRGEKQAGPRSSNTKGSENVITDGSRVDVADGQFLLIVENGKVVDFCGEAGQYLYQTGTQPSMLSGGFKGLGESFKEFGRRFTAGGEELSSQRVYYVNTKELIGNKWGIGEVPFRDSEFNFTMKISAYGEYSYQITNPLAFYGNVSGNVEEVYTRDSLDSQLKAELQSALQPVLGRIALKKVSYDTLPLFTKDICTELNAELTESWSQKRGLSVVSVAVASVTPDEESAAKIASFQEARVYTDPTMMGARLGTAQANAMENAAKNEAGAMTGFMGMGFAQQAGGANAAQMYQMGASDEKPEAAPAEQGEKSREQAAAQESQPKGWQCSSCGALNQGKFCSECGAKKPEGAPLYRCDKCGWQPEDPHHPPKFCPECGDRFDDEDKA